MHSDADAQEMCRKWVEKQKEYRGMFVRLFVRQWLLASDLSVESYAAPAYEAVSNKYAGGALASLKPHGDVRFRSELRPGKPGYIFEIDIPYSSFPPLSVLQLNGLRLMVDVFSAAPQGRREGPFSTTSAVRAYGKPDTFNVLSLSPPHAFELSPCGNTLQGTDAYRTAQPAWFIPKAGPDNAYQADAFLIVNEAHGYQYEPGDTVSPNLRPIHFFWSGIGPAEWVCGPQLAYRNGDTIREFPVSVSQDGFDARRTSDGGILIKEGPRVWHSEFGSGQCGGCPRTELKITIVDRSLNLVTLLDLGAIVQSQPSSQDFAVSPDWSQIVEYDQSGDDQSHLTWSSVTYCFTAGHYAQCDHKADVEPPDPPVIREFLE